MHELADLPPAVRLLPDVWLRGHLRGTKRSARPKLGALWAMVLFLCFNSASANS